MERERERERERELFHFHHNSDPLFSKRAKTCNPLKSGEESAVLMSVSQELSLSLQVLHYQNTARVNAVTQGVVFDHFITLSV